VVTLTAASRLQTNLFLYWRPDGAEPLARMTDLTESAALPGIYHDRMFIETLPRDLKSGGYDMERGRLTDTKRLTALLIPMTLAYILPVIQGHLDDLRQPYPPLKKRRWSLFAHARQIFQDVCDRKPFSVGIRFFQQFFTVLGQVLSHTTLEDDMSIFLKFSKQQHALLQ
jgi:hypothetical protein